ncbi:bifunctional riboflavin kinase/FAD synthetase [Sphingomonas sp. IC4-52]|uniref:bifunctional riboflavin kinase/FAD synthetase n=1 Tax=Sphingomonas sp. IC4-52 TaxID=2887202 RepID=UPI001D114479|nr:bifunctional riboflavin kinase/FAD synthetase [Sphingomonas sp. IC4-52]MCC2979827.1 bifunctional riboflavin kinase/FAD synthetase [Sphingomonas sp. IC4-52]
MDRHGIIRLGKGEALSDALRGGIVALGNFDGFHLGHQAVVGRAVERARAEGRPALVATFDPHPMRFFKPDSPWFRLSTLEQRAELMQAAGVDAMLVFAFDAELAALSAEAFVTSRLVQEIGAAGVVTGADFTFGKARSGDVSLLAALGQAHGFSADTVGAVTYEGGTVSSTRIRAALREGRPRDAARLLTRPFTIRGEVRHGDKLGREIGYPTANVDLGNYLRPAYGIYAVRVTLEDGRVFNGAANLGIRPSFDPPKELLEPYLFDFSGDLYGQTIDVALIDYLRPEAKFDTLEALKEQMAADCDRARKLLAR